MTAFRDAYGVTNPKDVQELERALVNRLIYSIGKDPVDTQPRDWFYALAHVVRDLLTVKWMESMRNYYLQDAKRVYYLSMEFLIGRTSITPCSTWAVTTNSSKPWKMWACASRR